MKKNNKHDAIRETVINMTAQVLAGDASAARESAKRINTYINEFEALESRKAFTIPPLSEEDMKKVSERLDNLHEQGYPTGIVMIPIDKQVYQYHGRASDMPKRLRDYFKHIGKEFDKDAFVDIVEHVEIEIVNEWLAGK